MKKTLRKILPVLALVLVVAVASVGGTLAWLKVATAPVVNTFTVGDINIDLTETEGKQSDGSYKFKIIPGVDIAKDPKVTVKANSEACWLFVKIEEKNWPDFMETLGDETTGTERVRKVNYAIAEGWYVVPDTNNVFYREVSATKADTDFAVLKENKVTVRSSLTKAEASAITTSPTLTFTAYAVQKDGINDVATAWAQASTANTTGTN